MMDNTQIAQCIEEMKLGNKLFFKTSDGLVFAVGMLYKYGLWWTTIYQRGMATQPLKPVKGYKNKLLPMAEIIDWLSRLEYIEYA